MNSEWRVFFLFFSSFISIDSKHKMMCNIRELNDENRQLMSKRFKTHELNNVGNGNHIRNGNWIKYQMRHTFVSKLHVSYLRRGTGKRKTVHWQWLWLWLWQWNKYSHCTYHKLKLHICTYVWFIQQRLRNNLKPKEISMFKERREAKKSNKYLR